MNPLRLLVLLVTLPLLLGGCGGDKNEPVAETKPVEEKVLEVKDEVKHEEPVAETKPELEGVNMDEELEPREDIVYIKGSDTPYTGKAFALYENGQKESEVNFKDGNFDGLGVEWYENGQKQSEGNYKDGKDDGLWVYWYENGQKMTEGNFKDGKRDGLVVFWHENGQKRWEVNYKNGKPVEGSEKLWNSKGEPVDSLEEANK